MKKDISPARKRLYAIVIIILVLLLLAVRDSSKKEERWDFYDEVEYWGE